MSIAGGPIRNFVVVTVSVALLAGCAPADSTASGAASAATIGNATPTPDASDGSQPSASQTPEATVSPARWTDCGGGFTCAEVRVPRDYAAPSQGYFNISLIRSAATKPAQRIGSLLINPGGPGGSGVEFVREGATGFSDELRERFDLVGFDPRGVNSSTAIRCIDNLDGHAALDPSPDDAAELEELVDAAREYAKACARRSGTILPYLSTDAVARDLDQIRAAVGDDQLSYLGFSYGTLIGALYGELFPDHIRAMVLDGAVDPSQGLEEFRADQAVAFEGALSRFLNDCASRPKCPFYEGGDAVRAFDRLMASIDKNPIPAPYLDDPRLVGSGLAWYAVIGALYSESYWPVLAAALAEAKAGDGSLMLVISDPFRGRKPNGSYSNQQDAYTANTCLDFAAPADIADYTGWATQMTETAPHFAELLAYTDLTCAFWSVPATGVPRAITAAGAPPIVVVGTTGDPATPHRWAIELADQLESGVLVTRKGEGHGAYFDSGCVEAAVDDYLLELTVPEDGLTCE